MSCENFQVLSHTNKKIKPTFVIMAHAQYKNLIGVLLVPESRETWNLVLKELRCRQGESAK